MTLQYRYTSGIHANTGGTPWDTTRTGVIQDAQPTTRLAMYDAMATALLAMGWQRYNRTLAGASVSQATRDDVWFSDGESGKEFIIIRTAIHAASGAAGVQYLSVIIAPKRNDAATALTGTWTWNGTTTVTATNTGQVAIGSWIKLNSDGQWFQITNVVVNTNVTIVAGGFTIPSGATGSSVLAPDVVDEIGNSALGNTGSFADDRFRWDLGGSDFSADYQMVGDKDSFHYILQNTAHSGSMFAIEVGRLSPLDCNPNTMQLGTTVAAGDFVELLTVDQAGASVNPISLGYRPLDRVRIVNVARNGNARAETQAVVRVQSDRITVRRLRFGYDGRNVAVNPQVDGARIGPAACPTFMNLSVNAELELNTTPNAGLNHFRGLFHVDDGIDQAPPTNAARTHGDLSSVVTVKVGENFFTQHYAQLTTHAQIGTEYGSGVTPNNRTLRFTIRSVAFAEFPLTSGAAGGFLGKIPRLAAYPGTASFYPHDNMKRDRITPNQDFVPFRYTSASARIYLLGPTPGP